MLASNQPSHLSTCMHHIATWPGSSPRLRGRRATSPQPRPHGASGHAYQARKRGPSQRRGPCGAKVRYSCLTSPPPYPGWFVSWPPGKLQIIARTAREPVHALMQRRSSCFAASHRPTWLRHPTDGELQPALPGLYGRHNPQGPSTDPVNRAVPGRLSPKQAGHGSETNDPTPACCIRTQLYVFVGRSFIKVAPFPETTCACPSQLSIRPATNRPYPTSYNPPPNA